MHNDNQLAILLLICRSLILGEHCIADDRGRVNFLGVFNQLNGEQFPVGHDLFEAAFKLAALRRPVLQETLVIEPTVALDGQPIGIISKTMRDVTIESGRSLSANLELRPLIFDQPGDYRVQLTVNGRVVPTRPLAVCLVGERTG